MPDMSPPSLSVIIPSRDRAGMVAAAIDSLLAQTRRPDRIIVVDDGSVDGTGDVLARYAGVIHVEHTQGIGPAGARNRGLAVCDSDLVGFCDSDDVLLPDALALMQAAIVEHGADAAWGRTITQILPGGAAPHFGWPTAAAHLVFLPSMVVGRAHLMALGGFDGALRFGEDGDLMQRMIERGSKIARVAADVAIYRRHAANMTQDRDASTRAWFDVARNVMARRRAMGAGA
ncbi:glycosyltransferase [Novosphingobium sp. FSY-8]|uniref:Glycosyltransferase n=1 Tax=Novosphingobium ovatum TaxID=1908523 RepID=A0ABW9XHD1_9SPHN|nr:glycosyltransferase [Novosphingobium ovatum]NBC37921.1 glycosyltransferase [Novosphingobium ovatum]